MACAGVLAGVTIAAAVQCSGYLVLLLLKVPIFSSGKRLINHREQKHVLSAENIDDNVKEKLLSACMHADYLQAVQSFLFSCG